MKQIFTLLLTFSSILLFAQSTQISQDVLNKINMDDAIPCILTLKDQYKVPKWVKNLPKEEKGTFVYEQLVKFNKKAQQEIVHYLSEENITFKPYVIFNGIYVEINKVQLSELVNSFDIAHISYDARARVQKVVKEAPKRIPLEWGIQKIEADSVWLLGYEGQGVVIGGQDTGYDFDNSLIVEKYRGYTDGAFDHNYSWHDAIKELDPSNEGDNPCGLDSKVPCDDHGHGSHTVGTMVGQDENNGIGVAPKAKWIGCRNMERGAGKLSTYAECFEWFLAPTDLNGENPMPTLAPHVINNSWACTEEEGCNPDNWQPLELAVNNLVDAGIMVVSSAGNDGFIGCGSISTPASVFPNAFVVGASDQTDTLAYFSSIGPVTIDSSFLLKPDVVAPGVDVRSITLGDLQAWSGTSMAGPHVAGAVALIISANPDLAGQVEAISDILKSTAVPLKDDFYECNGMDALSVPNFVYGHGRINAYAAVQKATTWVSNKEVPSIDHEVILFPNPNRGTCTIDIPNLDRQESFQFNIYDFSGKKIQEGSIQSFPSTIKIDAQSGIYYYQLKNNTKQYSGKIVIQ